MESIFQQLAQVMNKHISIDNDPDRREAGHSFDSL